MDDSQGAVDFSVSKIELMNYYGVEAQDIQGSEAFQRRATHYVQNKSNFSRKVRVAVSESSNPVSRYTRTRSTHVCIPVFLFLPLWMPS